MARKIQIFGGTGTLKEFVAGDFFTLDIDGNPLKWNVDILLAQALCRSLELAPLVEFEVSADGDYDVPGWKPHVVNNAGGMLTNFTPLSTETLVKQMRYQISVSDAVISATPKVRYGSAFGDVAVEGTGTNLSPLTGTAACSATSLDFSGTDQYQSVGLPLVSGQKIYKPQLTIANTGGNSYNVRCRVLLDIYIDLP